MDYHHLIERRKERMEDWNIGRLECLKNGRMEIGHWQLPPAKFPLRSAKQTTNNKQQTTNNKQQTTNN
ncbi:MAG: hypothetical protein ACOYM7_12285, partial [Paludibacter sp.]